MLYIFPLLSGLLWGLSALINKRDSDNNIDPLVSSLIYNFIGLIVSLFLLFISKIDFTASLNSYLGIFISAILSAIGFLFYFKAMATADVSLISILNRVAVIVAVMGGIFIFSEILNTYQVLGLFLILLGIFAPGIKNIKYLTQSGSIYALMSGISFGLSNILDKYASQEFSASSYIVVGYLLTTLIIFFTLLFMGKINMQILKINKMRLFISGGMNAFAFYFLMLSITLGGSMSISHLLTQIRLPFIMFGGILVFKEKEIGKTKIIGSVLIIIGAILLQIK